MGYKLKQLCNYYEVFKFLNMWGVKNEQISNFQKKKYD